MTSMKIDTFILGDFQTNSYVVRPNDSSVDCVVIDTGMSSEPLIEFLKTNNLNPVAALLTHGHADHIAGVNLLRETFPGIKVAIHNNDAVMLANPVKNLSVMVGQPYKTQPADVVIENCSPLEYAGIKFQPIHTPGHTPGGICLYCQDDGIVFVGDTLFACSIGRTDFPGGDSEMLLNSIRKELFTLPDETKVYNGHGPATTIGNEKRTNPFLMTND